MSKQAYEHVFNGTIEVAPGAYDPAKLNVSSLLGQFSLGASPKDKFIGPLPVQTVRPMEASTAIPAGTIHIEKWSSTRWWLFYTDNASAAATRRIGVYNFDPTTGAINWNGFITLTFPTNTNHTIRGFRAFYEKYTTGTVAVSGTAVTGSSTLWVTDKMKVGSRIGFGSNNPSAITTWYEISAIGSNTSITLTTAADTFSAGTQYVIEDLMLAIETTNATATNGGLYIVKGLRIENFAVAGTAIPAATTVDNIRAVYWLKDASTITNTVGGGLAKEAMTTWSSQFVYVVNGAATSLIVYKYNIRAALGSLSAGAQVLTGGDLVITGTAAVTGNISQNNNGRVATLNHGPGNGVPSLYFVTASRIYRTALSNIVGGSTTYLSDAMTENPPGSTATFPAVGALGQVEHSGSIDRLIVSNSANKCYVTQYRTDGGQMDNIFLTTNNQQDQGIASVLSIPHPHIQTGVNPTIWVEDGICFFCAPSTTATTNQIWVFPLAAHYDYSDVTGHMVIGPVMNLGSIPSKFYRVLVNRVDNLGDDEFGKAPEPFKLWYRTSGIADNSGVWTAMDDSGDMSGVGVSAQIQWGYTFKTIGDNCIPARIISMAVIYETTDPLPSQYQWSFSDTNAGTATWGFEQVALESSITKYTINIYRGDNNLLVLTQDSDSTINGTFEYYNGSAWVAGLGPNVVGTRRRFVATGSLPGSVNLYAILTSA